MAPSLKTILVVSLVVCFTSCASIVSKSNWPFSVDSNPSGANVSIVNKRGIEVYNGRTPAAMLLKSGSGFFGKESYIVTISQQGYETKKVNIECKINGWYFGNILLGGVIGMLIVDPATGAMYKLGTEGITETLEKQSSSTGNNKQPELKIVMLNQVSAEARQHLVKL